MFLRSARRRILLVAATSAFGLTLHNRVTRNDSSGNAQWPQTRPRVESRSKKPDGQQDDKRDTIATESAGAEVSSFEDDDSAAWAKFSSRFTSVGKSVTSICWPDFVGKVADQILPQWAQALPDYVAKLQKEIEMAPGSLAEEIWQDAQDPDLHPSIQAYAQVRISKNLCPDELAFVEKRKKYTTQALARYLGIPEAEVDPRDVPTIAMCGSGGGLRALVAGASSFLSSQEAGLFDCATYTAGVSGSCWLQTLYFSSIGARRHGSIIEHLKRRIGVHIAYPPSFLDLLTRAPTNKYLLSGPIEKLKGDPNASFGLVDVYGVLLASRLLVPRDDLGVDDRDLKLSNQRIYLAEGANPLPIYAAVRHEIPIEEHKTEEKEAFGKVSDDVKEEAKKEAWFQWFEFTPYELFCEEWDAGIPSWSIGRRFSQGRGLFNERGLALPELGIPFMMGVWGSAFCATLAHYYKEVRPIVKGLIGFGGIDDLVEGRNDDLIKVHPIDPGSIPNYALGLEGLLPATCPRSIFKNKYLELMDAGMSNNLPLYPLLRKGRDVDIIVCFDASADIKQENWLSVADGYAKQRGIKGWPVGAGWPKEKDDTKRELDAADAATAQEAAGKIAEAREEQREKSQNETQAAIDKGRNQNQNSSDLSYCNVWVGTTMERTSDTERPQSKRVDEDADWQLLAPDAGITVVYFPFLPNPKVDGVDPNTSPYLSTWNFIYSPEEIDKVVSLARANFEAGRDRTKRTVRAVYERKKARRLEAEEKDNRRRWRNHWREHGDHFQ